MPDPTEATSLSCIQCTSPAIASPRHRLLPTPPSPVHLRPLQADLTQDLERLLVRIQQTLDPRTLRHECLVLKQQLGKQVRLVQGRDEALLDRFSAKVDLT